MVAFERLEPQFPLSWRYLRFVAERFDNRWHSHPEFELTFILTGSGSRLVGDSVEEYRSGDLCLFGPNLPHTYVSTTGDGENEAVVAHFTKDFLGNGFFEAPAFATVLAMLTDANNGIRFSDAGSALVDLDGLPAAERTIELLKILVALSRMPYTVLTSGAAPSAPNRDSARRIELMIESIHSGLDGELTLGDIATAAHMNPSAASRLFTRSTGLTLTRYANVVRVNAACRLLRETDQSVASIAGDSGFANLSNFNRRFRELKSMSPREYRALFRDGDGSVDSIELQVHATAPSR